MMYCPEFKKDLEYNCLPYRSMMDCAQELKEAKDKLSRRNMQIKELKKTYQRRLVIDDNMRQNIAFLEKFIEDNKLNVPHFEGVTNFDFALRGL